MGWIFFSHKSNSGEIARRRLKQVLVSDQSGCSPGLIEGIREELIGVLSRYMESVFWLKVLPQESLSRHTPSK